MVSSVNTCESVEVQNRSRGHVVIRGAVQFPISSSVRAAITKFYRLRSLNGRFFFFFFLQLWSLEV